MRRLAARSTGPIMALAAVLVTASIPPARAGCYSYPSYSYYSPSYYSAPCYSSPYAYHKAGYWRGRYYPAGFYKWTGSAWYLRGYGVHYGYNYAPIEPVNFLR